MRREPGGLPVGIREYRTGDEAAWLRCWGQVAVTSHAWGLPAYQTKPIYRKPAVELVAVVRAVRDKASGGDGLGEDGGLDEIVGFIDVEIEEKPGELGLLTDSRCGFVWELGLLPSYRGRGLGRALIAAAAERLKSAGVFRMEFWSMDEQAQAFYNRLGMREINRHWRFWARVPSRVIGGERPASLKVEYVHATCSVEDWPKSRETWSVIEEPPMEPHLCRGFDYRF